MFHELSTLFNKSVMERLALLLNHVLNAEPAAVRRLAPHAGRSVALSLDGWPRLLPSLPGMVFRITPAGLVEWCEFEALDAPDLRVRIDASNPALALGQMLTGGRPKVEVSGDAAFAGDLNWLFDNLRWDVQDDLARIVGQGPAREIGRIGGAVAGGMRELVRTVSGLVQRSSARSGR